MVTRLKTRQRIISTSLELFNQLGERTVSTNHIAAHMEISPGNLYYHFPNKQAIISELFNEFDALMLGFLCPPAGRLPDVNDKREYLKQLLNAIWQYRFLYRDIEHLLRSDADLAVRYRHFSRQCLVQGQAVFTGFVQAGILGMTPQQVESLTVNAWIILTSWVGFLCATCDCSDQLSEQAIKRGIHQLLVLESGFVTAPYRCAVDELLNEYYVPLQNTMDVQ
ncbi:TetR/AcrR family transcriptional regulator [Pseudomonas sp. SIMBA_077]